METAASLSPLGLFLQAGTVAKVVIILLLGASARRAWVIRPDRRPCCFRSPMRGAVPRA